MKLVVLSLALVLASASGYAFADPAVVATLKTPLEKPIRPVRGSTAWQCDKSECRTTAASTETYSWESCRDLARAVGPVSAYGSLDAAKLAKCNGAK